MHGQFCSCFIKNYLPNLHEINGEETLRNKKEGKVVLIMDRQQPRGLWPVGIIPSNDGKIQTVKVTSTETGSQTGYSFASRISL